ncbi:MAG TPA: hypothetical protein VLD16_12665 [Gaiellaceae bacterium]|nr:hypothetical protein [Gaiellaceae bacterium]
MATHLRTAGGTSRTCGIDSVAQMYDNGEELVVLVRLNGGLLELRVPRRTVAPEQPHRITGVNADATPC